MGWLEDQQKQARDALGGGQYLNAQEKQMMLTEGTPFVIVRAFDRISPFDPNGEDREWVYEIVIEGADEVRALTMGANDYRTALARAIAERIAETQEPVGPFRLVKTSVSGGKFRAWDFESADAPRVAPKEEAESAAVAAARKILNPGK